MKRYQNRCVVCRCLKLGISFQCDRCTYPDPKYRRMVIANRKEDAAQLRAQEFSNA